MLSVSVEGVAPSISSRQWRCSLTYYCKNLPFIDGMSVETIHLVRGFFLCLMAPDGSSAAQEPMSSLPTWKSPPCGGESDASDGHDGWTPSGMRRLGLVFLIGFSASKNFEPFPKSNRPILECFDALFASATISLLRATVDMLTGKVMKPWRCLKIVSTP